WARFARQLENGTRHDMFHFRGLGIKSKLALLTGIFVFGFTIFGAFSYATLNTVKINGPYYRTIADGKDLVADILPPPEYIIEVAKMANAQTSAQEPSTAQLLRSRTALWLGCGVFTVLVATLLSCLLAGAMDRAIRAISRNAQSLALASEELAAISHQMGANAEETSSQAGVVSTAAEEVSKNVQTVSAGTEEMGASIKEIARS